MGAAAGAVVAAAAAASAASSAASQLDHFSQAEEKVSLPDLTNNLNREATISVLTIGGVHTIVGTMLAVDDEWLVLRGRNAKHFLIPVQRVLAMRLEVTEESGLPRST